MRKRCQKRLPGLGPERLGRLFFDRDEDPWVVRGGWGRELEDMLVFSGWGHTELLMLALCRAVFSTFHRY